MGRFLQTSRYSSGPLLLNLAMNTKQFLILFFSACVLSFATGLGSLAAVTYNSALYLPLIGGASGGLGTVLAALGALKLGAVALLLASNFKGEEVAESADETGYGAQPPRHYRQRRAASAALGPDPDSLFQLVNSMDLYSCGKQLVCELEAKPASERSSEEMLMISLFGKGKKSVNPASAKAEYDLAAELGMASKSQVVCRKRYSTCPYTAEEMMEALSSSRL